MLIRLSKYTSYCNLELVTNVLIATLALAAIVGWVPHVKPAWDDHIIT